MTPAGAEGPTEAVLVARAVSKSYGALPAVRSFDVALQPGRIVGLVGNNGAGKSTVLKVLCGLLEPSTGTATLRGIPTLQASARARIGFVPEDSPLYEELTPLQTLAFFGRLYRVPAVGLRERSEQTLRRLRLGEEHWTKPVGTLSKGSARKVALARALLHLPDVLILDEPASGLDPATRAELDAVLLEERDRGAAILLSAHNMAQVERLCDEVLLMHAGRVAARGTIGELRADWGGSRFRVVASQPFDGSTSTPAGHQAELATMEEAGRAIAQVQARGGQLVEMTTVQRGLEDILRRIEAAG